MPSTTTCACGSPPTRRAQPPGKRRASPPTTRGRARRTDGGPERRRRGEGEREQRRDHRRGESVGEHGVDGHRVEVAQEDRCRRDAARPPTPRSPPALADRIALEPSLDDRDGGKIAATAANESWKPGSRSVYGFHASKTAAPTRKKYQRSSRTSGEPRERGKPAGDPGADHRGLPADREDVRADRRSAPTARTPAGRPSSQPSEKHACDDADVLTRDGEQVVETRGPERSRSSSSRPSSSPSTTPTTTARRSPSRPAAECPRWRAYRVGEAADPAAPANDREAVGPQHDLDPLFLQVGGLVEAAALRRPRQATDATSSSTAPCAGARPRGSSSRLSSRGSSAPKRTTRTGTRTANSLVRAGPVTSTRASALSPACPTSREASSASRRRLPHHQPPARSAAARSAAHARACRAQPGERERHDGKGRTR